MALEDVANGAPHLNSRFNPCDMLEMRVRERRPDDGHGFLVFLGPCTKVGGSRRRCSVTVGVAFQLSERQNWLDILFPKMEIFRSQFVYLEYTT